MCSVCGIDYPEHEVWVVYSYTLWTDTICPNCYRWMDRFMRNNNGRKYTPWCDRTRIHYEDRSLDEIRSKKDTHFYSAYPVYLP